MECLPSRIVLPRLRSFWLGLPILIFLAWCWADSMTYDSRANWLHGPFMTKKSKLLERDYRNLSLPPPGLLSLDLPSFNLSELPAERLPLSPSNFQFRPIVDPTLEAPEMQFQRCLSIGNKQGTVWLSDWDSLRFASEKWTRLKDNGASTWFPGFQFQSGSEGEATTLWLPHWLLLSGYGAIWGAVMGWRIKRRRSAAGFITV